MRRKSIWKYNDKSGSPQDQTKEAEKRSQNWWRTSNTGKQIRQGDTNQQPETIGDNEPESERESHLIRGDNFPTVDLKAYNTEEKRPSSYK